MTLLVMDKDNSERDYCLRCGDLIGYRGDLLCAHCQSDNDDDDDDDDDDND